MTSSRSCDGVFSTISCRVFVHVNDLQHSHAESDLMTRRQCRTSLITRVWRDLPASSSSPVPFVFSTSRISMPTRASSSRSIPSSLVSSSLATCWALRGSWDFSRRSNTPSSQAENITWGTKTPIYLIYLFKFLFDPLTFSIQRQHQVKPRV